MAFGNIFLSSPCDHSDQGRGGMSRLKLLPKSVVPLRGQGQGRITLFIVLQSRIVNLCPTPDPSYESQHKNQKHQALNLGPPGNGT